MSGFDLFDAIDNSNDDTASGSNQQSKSGPWSGDQSHGLWPEDQSGAGGMWPGNPQGGSTPAPGGWPSPAPGYAFGGDNTPARSPNQSLSVPYRMNIRNGVHEGLIIGIKGVVKPNANRFTVDLCNREDIAFHFNPRFNEGGRQVIVRNTCQRKKWGQEERNLGHFPFALGKEFEMEILCTPSEFKVSVNRSLVLTFKHRITDLRSIDTLSIHNDLDLINVDQRIR